MTIEGLQFLQATLPSYNAYKTQRNNQNYYQMPSTTAQVNPSYRPSVEDFERAQQYIDGNINLNGKINQLHTTRTPQSAKGLAFEGFNVPQNNGTGELIADVSNREDSIEDCAWEPYFA